MSRFRQIQASARAPHSMIFAKKKAVQLHEQPTGVVMKGENIVQWEPELVQHRMHLESEWRAAVILQDGQLGQDGTSSGHDVPHGSS